MEQCFIFCCQGGSLAFVRGGLREVVARLCCGYQPPSTPEPPRTPPLWRAHYSSAEENVEFSYFFQDEGEEQEGRRTANNESPSDGSWQRDVMTCSPPPSYVRARPLFLSFRAESRANQFSSFFCQGRFVRPARDSSRSGGGGGGGGGERWRSAARARGEELSNRTDPARHHTHSGDDGIF